MVAEGFPEAWVILVHQGKAPHPFRALPEVKMGDKKSCRATMFGREIFVVKAEGDPCLLVHEVFEWQIRGVVTIRMHKHILGIRLYACKYRIQGNAFPNCA